jgi:hypothetical protein
MNGTKYGKQNLKVKPSDKAVLPPHAANKLVFGLFEAGFVLGKLVFNQPFRLSSPQPASSVGTLVTILK